MVCRPFLPAYRRLNQLQTRPYCRERKPPRLQDLSSRPLDLLPSQHSTSPARSGGLLCGTRVETRSRETLQAGRNVVQSGNYLCCGVHLLGGFLHVPSLFPRTTCTTEVVKSEPWTLGSSSIRRLQISCALRRVALRLLSQGHLA